MVFVKKIDFFETEKIIQGLFDSYFEERKHSIFSSPVTQETLKEKLLDFDTNYRKILLEQTGGTPLLDYMVFKTRKKNIFNVTVKRNSRLQVKHYKDFKIKIQFSINDTESVISTFEKQKEIYYNILRETLILKSLNYFNELFRKHLKSVESPLKVIFTPDVFSNKYVEFISDEYLVLTAETDGLLELVDYFDNLSVDELALLEEEEEMSLILSHSTTELLERKTLMMKKLLNLVRMTPKVLVSLPFRKTMNQMIVYPNSEGYAYFLESSVFGAIIKDEYSTQVLVSPINLNTFEKENIDLVGLATG